MSHRVHLKKNDMESRKYFAGMMASQHQQTRVTSPVREVLVAKEHLGIEMQAAGIELGHEVDPTSHEVDPTSHERMPTLSPTSSMVP